MPDTRELTLVEAVEMALRDPERWRSILKAISCLVEECR
jgi:hypothetical protein